MHEQRAAEEKTPIGTGCPDSETLAQWVCDRTSVDPQVADHIGNCPNCRKETAAWQATVDALRKIPETTPSDDLAARIMANIEPQRSDFKLLHFPQRYRMAIAVAAAATAVLSITGIVLQDMRFHPRGQSPAPGSINWLSKAQSPDGSWHPERFGGREIYTDALTGLSLMGLAEEARQSHRQPTDGLLRAAAYLVGRQQPDGRFGDVEGDAAMYNHTMASLGLTQAMPLVPKEKRPALLHALTRASDYTLSQQQTGGGWGYATTVTTSPPNMGVTSWAVQSLMRAQEAGIDGQTEEAVTRGVRWLAAQIQPAGSFSYQPASAAQPATATLTAMGALCILQAGRSITPPAIVEQVRSTLEQLAPAEVDDIYGRYLLACALDAAETERCGKLLAQLRDSVAARHLDAEGKDHQGWAEGDRWAGTGGEVYATALAWLTLHADPH